MSIFSKVIGFFTGGAARKVTDTANDVNNIVERWKPSKAKQHEMQMDVENLVQKAQESARQMTLVSHNTGFDVLVDGINRLIRPVITIWIIGGFMDLWELPSTDHIPEIYFNIMWTVVGFWFGGRVLLKDLPTGIAKATKLIKMK